MHSCNFSQNLSLIITKQNSPFLVCRMDIWKWQGSADPDYPEVSVHLWVSAA